MYGTDLGFSATFVIDPTSARFPSGLEISPIPVAPRGASLAAAASWDTPQVQAESVNALGPIMGALGFRLIAAEITGSTMRVRYQNNDFRAEAQGVGRVARLLTQFAPANVETFILEPLQRGIALSAVTLRRGDLEMLENAPNAAALSYDRAGFSDAAGPAPTIGWNDPTPAFLWGVAPYIEITLFDGNKPHAATSGSRRVSNTNCVPIWCFQARTVNGFWATATKSVQLRARLSRPFAAKGGATVLKVAAELRTCRCLGMGDPVVISIHGCHSDILNGCMVGCLPKFSGNLWTANSHWAQR
jgi:hypothetical protein